MPHPSPDHRFSLRARQIKISATKLMPMLAAEVGGCVSLGQGVPSFATPGFVVEAVCHACASPGRRKISLQPGLPDLRRAVAAFLPTKRAFTATRGKSSSPWGP